MYLSREGNLVSAALNSAKSPAAVTQKRETKCLKNFTKRARPGYKRWAVISKET
jgi:hypothetical protein